MTAGWQTFGNHGHWVDMEWLWGPGMPARPVTDMLDLVERTGAHTVATIGLQLAATPGSARNLDEDRTVWATVHRQAE